MTITPVLTNGTTTVQIVKRMVFLAYNACGGPVGMGVFQARAGASEEDVWSAAYGMTDYPGGRKIHGLKDHEVYCDYVMGRMIKWGCKWDDKTITFSEWGFSPDYQSFCGSYPAGVDLYSAALKSLGIEVTP